MWLIIKGRLKVPIAWRHVRIPKAIGLPLSGKHNAIMPQWILDQTIYWYPNKIKDIFGRTLLIQLVFGQFGVTIKIRIAKRDRNIYIYNKVILFPNLSINIPNTGITTIQTVKGKLTVILASYVS